MGLQMNFNYKGLEIQNGYIKVAHIDGNKNRMYFNLQYYSNKTSADSDTLDNRNSNSLTISPMYTIVPDLTSIDNVIKQMYDYLKTLPEFSTVVDV